MIRKVQDIKLRMDLKVDGTTWCPVSQKGGFTIGFPQFLWLTVGGSDGYMSCVLKRASEEDLQAGNRKSMILKRAQLCIVSKQ